MFAKNHSVALLAIGFWAIVYCLIILDKKRDFLKCNLVLCCYYDIDISLKPKKNRTENGVFLNLRFFNEVIF